MLSNAKIKQLEQSMYYAVSPDRKVDDEDTDEEKVEKEIEETVGSGDEDDGSDRVKSRSRVSSHAPPRPFRADLPEEESDHGSRKSTTEGNELVEESLTTALKCLAEDMPSRLERQPAELRDITELAEKKVKSEADCEDALLEWEQSLREQRLRSSKGGAVTTQQHPREERKQQHQRDGTGLGPGRRSLGDRSEMRSKHASEPIVSELER